MTVTIAPRLARILWQRLDAPGLEWCSVAPDPVGSTIEGVALVAWDARY